MERTKDRNDLDDMVPDLAAKLRESIKSEQEQGRAKADNDDIGDEASPAKKPRTEPETH